MLSTKEELYLYLEKISRGYALKDTDWPDYGKYSVIR